MAIHTARLGLVGADIAYSRSPAIHQHIAKQCGHTVEYRLFELDAQEVEPFCRAFFAEGGQGLNITNPYKSSVFQWVDRPSERAQQCGSCNVLWSQEQEIGGDIVDGLGWQADMVRLGWPLAGAHVCLWGFGGVGPAILLALSEMGVKHVSIMVRDTAKVQRTLEHWRQGPSWACVPWGSREIACVDGVIQASACVDHASMADCMSAWVHASTWAYDLNYGARAQSFRSVCRQVGIHRFQDGMGMLIEQARAAWLPWMGVKPEVDLPKLLAAL